MKLRVLEQIHVSAVSSETLRRGQVVDVSNAAGEELLSRHPDKFEHASKAARRTSNKQAPKPENKSQA